MSFVSLSLLCEVMRWCVSQQLKQDREQAELMCRSKNLYALITAPPGGCCCITGSQSCVFFLCFPVSMWSYPMMQHVSPAPAVTMMATQSVPPPSYQESQQVRPGHHQHVAHEQPGWDWIHRQRTIKRHETCCIFLTRWCSADCFIWKW